MDVAFAEAGLIGRRALVAVDQLVGEQSVTDTVLPGAVAIVRTPPQAFHREPSALEDGLRRHVEAVHLRFDAMNSALAYQLRAKIANRAGGNATSAKRWVEHQRLNVGDSTP